MKSMLFLAALAMVSSSIIPVMASDAEDSIEAPSTNEPDVETVEVSPSHNS